MAKFKLSISFLAILLPATITATSSGVVINEIAWMGTEASYNDEWIELYNGSSFDLELDGWKLIAEDGSPAINLSGKITAKGFFLLERTDNETLPDIEANLIYKGSLSNTGERLKLLAENGEVVDEIDCSSEWFAGNNKEKTTMERKDPLVIGNDPQNWQTSQNPGGTPKEGAKQEEMKHKSKEVEQEPKEAIKYPSNIFINEILPSPDGPDAENEWIEIFNQNDFKVNLSGWEITDSVGGTKSYTFPEETAIEAKGFLVLSRLLTKITLNNDGDSLILFNPNGAKADEANYGKALQGESFNKIGSIWKWSPDLTPGAPNAPPPLEGQEQEETAIPQSNLPSSSPTKENIAAISEQVPRSLSPAFILLIALAIASISGAGIIFLKKSIAS